MFNQPNKSLQSKSSFRCPWFVPALATIALLLAAAPGFADNKIMGEVQFDPASKVEKTSGIWIDGQYVGYLKELKGDKKVLLLPGEHEITARLAGFQDFVRKIDVQPGEKQTVRVAMQVAPRGEMPSATATLKLTVQPERAAVFLDGRYVGHAAEFGGKLHSMVVAAGKHQIRVELPGYRTFHTEVSLLADQKLEVKTDLVKGGASQEDALMNQASNQTASNPN